MRIFVSYSYKPENQWIEDLVIPLLRCFGHEPVTGRILDTGTLEEEVRRKMASCRNVICFTTRTSPRYDATGAITGHDAPRWVEDELIMARTRGQAALEFRENGVIREGAAKEHVWVAFDREDRAALLLEIAERVKEWPIGPLNLRLEVPEPVREDVERAVNAGTLLAAILVDEDGSSVREDLKVRLQDRHLIVPFWFKLNPKHSIDIEISLGGRLLVSRGISPTVRDAKLTAV